MFFMLETQKEIRLKISGMTCSNCAFGIERELITLGAENVKINFANGLATFNLSSADKLNSVFKILDKRGFKGSLEKDHSPKFEFSVFAKFLIVSILTLPLLLGMYLPWHLLHQPFLQLILSTPVVLIGFLHFGPAALSSIKERQPNMDVLILIGVGAAFLYSLIGTIFNLGPDYQFYETAATIVTFVLLGNLIEHKAISKTTSAVHDLTQLQSGKAHKILDLNKNDIVDVDIQDLLLGDLLQINSGEKVPLDAIIKKGNGSLDESLLTGESLPLEKTIGDKIIGGTVLVSGNLIVETVAIGANTVMAGLIRLVEQAQKDQPKIQRIGDKVSGIFVPIVVTLSILTFIINYTLLEQSLASALMRAIAVLVIACPCAMGLATPLAIMLGVGRAAKAGVLIKGGSTIEKLAYSNKFAFDKTGTLTTGKFKIKNINYYSSNAEEVGQIIASLTQESTHPISKSLNQIYKDQQKLELNNLREERGLGVFAIDKNDQEFSLGSKKLLPSQINGPEHDLYLFRNNALIAGIDIEDELKQDALSTIQNLKSFNIDPLLISGDHDKKCRSAAEKLGISKFFSEQNPAQKLELIKYESQNCLLTYVGDGVNDAPALAQASVGISLSSASQIAIQSAHIILLGSELNRVIVASRIAKLTLKIIKQNLFWAFFYNIFAIPLAAAGYLNPTLAALTMACSDVVIVFNSFRLKVAKL